MSCFKDFFRFLILVELTTDTLCKRVKEIFNKIKPSSKGKTFICVIGTKDDLVDLRKVSSEDALKLVQEFGVNYIECSSLTGHRVEKCVLIAAIGL